MNSKRFDQGAAVPWEELPPSPFRLGVHARALARDHETSGGGP
jgi:hypothetical protein